MYAKCWSVSMKPFELNSFTWWFGYQYWHWLLIQKPAFILVWEICGEPEGQILDKARWVWEKSSVVMMPWPWLCTFHISAQLHRLSIFHNYTHLFWWCLSTLHAQVELFTMIFLLCWSAYGKLYHLRLRKVQRMSTFCLWYLLLLLPCSEDHLNSSFVPFESPRMKVSKRGPSISIAHSSRSLGL